MDIHYETKEAFAETFRMCFNVENLIFSVKLNLSMPYSVFSCRFGHLFKVLQSKNP